MFCAQSWSWGWETGRQVAACVSSASRYCGERGGRDEQAGLLLSVLPMPPSAPIPVTLSRPHMYGFCCRQNEILIWLVCYRLIVMRTETSKELISALLNLRGSCFVFNNLSNQEKLALSAPNNSRKLGIQF